MNKTQKALWFSGMFAAILTAVLISMINDARGKLDKSVLDNVRQDSEIKHMANNYDSIKLELRDISVNQDTLIKVVTRVDEKLNSFERSLP
jgi:hypothetical protein